jgi:hypothetical protein
MGRPEIDLALLAASRPILRKFLVISRHGRAARLSTAGPKLRTNTRASIGRGIEPLSLAFPLAIFCDVLRVGVEPVN